MKLSEKVKKLRKENKVTQLQLAHKLKVSPSTVSAWELGTNSPLMDKITQMSDFFNVPISYFFDDVDMTSVNMAKVPVYGKISCGNGVVVFDDIVDYEEIPMDWLNGGSDYFMMIAEGDSMSGSRVFDGDKLLIRKQEYVDNGEIGVVVIGESSVLKKVRHQGDLLILESSNPEYETKVFDLRKTENVKIIGKLIKLIVDF